jgi:hypothetical protein
MEPHSAQLLDELIEAHLDTVELLQAAQPGEELRCHLDYVQALVRRATAWSARASPPAPTAAEPWS